MTDNVKAINITSPYTINATIVNKDKEKKQKELENLNKEIEQLRAQVSAYVANPFDSESIKQLEKQQEQYRQLLEKRLNIKKDLQPINVSSPYSLQNNITDTELEQAKKREEALEQQMQYKDVITQLTYNDYITALRDSLRQKMG